ncbi:hypothetical protein D3C78_1953820 [compost metagenome]
MTGNKVLLKDIVFTREYVTVFQISKGDLIEAESGRAFIPVVEVGDMDIMSIIETTPRPKRPAI